jgi:hypothetical protein
MNEPRVYFSSAPLIASTCVLLAMAGAVASQTPPVTHEGAHRRAEAQIEEETDESGTVIHS